jgi:hypothetical protein
MALSTTESIGKKKRTREKRKGASSRIAAPDVHAPNQRMRRVQRVNS